MSLSKTVSHLRGQLRNVHNGDDQKLIIWEALAEAVGHDKADEIISAMPWRANSGWTQLLYLIKHGHLGYPAVTETDEVAELTGASPEAVGRVLATV